ncbi:MULTISPECIES: teichoic acid transporter [unclassified Adlercreutzia]|uniref:teichoic acid transporter n=1 Tax=unclassified Adlercreutzia TaxID=2636013 RepID=UPI0013ED5FA0|nr:MULTISPECIES: teichoic acid transporter [unclassified Adlercreutzia]
MAFQLPFGSLRDPARMERPRAAAAPLPGFENENIRYLDAPALARPLELPQPVRAGALAGMLVAAVIGGVFLFQYFDAIVNAPAREQAALEENLAREVPIEVPALVSFMTMSDQEVMDALNASGATLYERVAPGTSEDGSFEVIKLPEGVTVADAGAMYLTGIDNLSAADAVRLLNGAWDLTVNHTSGSFARVRYADFTSLSVQEAVQSAINAAGLAECAIDDSGVDESGNTYAAGVIESEGNVYNWRVSALPLSEMYDISGIPASASYVGIKLTSA